MTAPTAAHICPACGRTVEDDGARFIDQLGGIRYHPMCFLGFKPIKATRAPTEQLPFVDVPAEDEEDVEVEVAAAEPALHVS